MYGTRSVDAMRQSEKYESFSKETHHIHFGVGGESKQLLKLAIVSWNYRCLFYLHSRAGTK